jgi:hypothetical protein
VTLEANFKSVMIGKRRINLNYYLLRVKKNKKIMKINK